MIVRRLSVLFSLLSLPVMLLCCASAPSVSSGESQGAPFDGVQFDNLEPFPDKNFLKVLRWRFSRLSTAANWPKKVEQTFFEPVSVRSKSLQAAVLGHSTALVQMDNLNILTDPHFSKRASPVSWAGPARVTQPGIPFNKLPPIDVVVISHNHYDHLDIPSLKRLRAAFNPTILVGLGTAELLEKHGISNVVEMNWWESIELNQVMFHMVPVQHWSARGLFDKRRALWGGYVIEGSKKVFFAGDTGYGKVFKMIGERYGAMDLSLIPIGAYAPRHFMKNAHINPEEAVKILLDTGSKKALGVHFRTFHGLTDEAIDQPAIDLRAAMRAYSVAEEDFIAPQFGRTYSY